MKKKPTHGGARPGAGRPKKEPTATLSYRVPISVAPLLDTKIRDLIRPYLNNKHDK